MNSKAAKWLKALRICFRYWPLIYSTQSVPLRFPVFPAMDKPIGTVARETLGSQEFSGSNLIRFLDRHTRTFEASEQF
ncbi:hypothetical protein DSM3645_14565 [Blastopirellula marina DSM 3645]|uniref:Uncharacterized protein n=1 Tax=Blastopirellula marina DSM 3645 TaxID=314230 RepID=A3ZSB7_9BACT|nr:hypothetical protein DSM3645_14565 [Blastopirellula marina DSM 3645]